MSSIMMIVPADWVDMDYQYLTVNNILSDALMTQYIATRNYGEFETIFRTVGKWPENAVSIKEVKLIDNTYLWAIFE